MKKKEIALTDDEFKRKVIELLSDISAQLSSISADIESIDTGTGNISSIDTNVSWIETYLRRAQGAKKKN